MEPWLADLKERAARLFDRDWIAHVRGLNAAYHLTGRDAFVESRWPPLWFQGDIESIEPGRWVAVLSLNPKTASDRWLDWLEQQEFTPESYWNYLRHIDLRGLDYFRDEYFYVKFDRPLVRLIARAVGEPLPVIADEVGYKRRRMRSFETIPYASHEYRLGSDTLRSLLDKDEGCRLAADFTRAVIANGRPAAVLLNGLPAVETFTEAWREAAELRVVEYPSDTRPNRLMKHWEGVLSTPRGPIPVVGFRQLRTISGHNSDGEVAQLGRYIARATGAPIAD